MVDRTTYIGSTESVALVEPEASPFCSEASIYLEKTGLAERGEPTERMNAGKYLERAILAEWNKRNDRGFRFNDRPHFLDAAERIGATPDGIEIQLAGQREGAEVKTVTAHRRGDWDNGVPRYVWWQTQHEMLCAKLDRVVVIAQFGFDELSHEWIEADPAAFERIISACNTMWDRIDGKLPPPAMDGHRATTTALAKRKLEAKAIELGDDVREWTQILTLNERKAKEANAIVAEMKNKIRGALGDASTGVWSDGNGWRVIEVNKKAFSVKASSSKQLKRITNKEAQEDLPDEWNEPTTY